MSIFQIVILGIIGVIFTLQIKQYRSESAILLSFAICIVICGAIYDKLGIFVQTMKDIVSFSNVEITYFSTLIKMLGIAYLSEFSSGICKDAGQQAIALQIEMFGKISILILSIPYLITLLQTIQEFIK
jgi:stage III sporulation protein AD